MVMSSARRVNFSTTEKKCLFCDRSGSNPSILLIIVESGRLRETLLNKLPTRVRPQ